MNTNKETIRLTKSKLRNIIRESVKKVLNENKSLYEENNVDFDYEINHDDDDFNPEDISVNDLIQFCRSFGDFFYIYKSFGQWKLKTASTEDVRYEIIEDLMTEPTINIVNTFDDLLKNKIDFRSNHVVVFSVDTSYDFYYIVYEKPKFFA